MALKSFKRREKITVIRNRYTVDYNFADALTPFSAVQLEYPTECEESDIIKDIEAEFKIWIEKFPIPIFAAAFNSNGELIDFTSQENSCLYGYKTRDGELIYSYGNIEFPKDMQTESYFEEIYADIPYETSEEIAARVKREGRPMRIFIRLFNVAWVAVVFVIPLSWAIAGMFYNTIAFISTLGVFLMGAYKTLKYFNIIKKTKHEKNKDDIKIRKEHYFYHCEKNPEGFNRLRNENWENEK